MLYWGPIIEGPVDFIRHTPLKAYKRGPPASCFGTEQAAPYGGGDVYT